MKKRYRKTAALLLAGILSLGSVLQVGATDTQIDAVQKRERAVRTAEAGSGTRAECAFRAVEQHYRTNAGNQCESRSEGC